MVAFEIFVVEASHEVIASSVGARKVKLLAAVSSVDKLDKAVM